MNRLQYITVDELQEVLCDSGEIYPNNESTLSKIYEASELLHQYCFRIDDYTTTTAPKNLKLATAYQVKYLGDNPNMDDEYAVATKSVSIGKTSESVSHGGGINHEYIKISPKAIRYLHDTSSSDDVLITRLL